MQDLNSSMRQTTVRNPNLHRRRPAHPAGPYNPRIQRPTLKHKPPVVVQHCPIFKKPPLTDQIVGVQHCPINKPLITTNKVVSVQNCPIKKPPKQEQIVGARHFPIRKPPPTKQKHTAETTPTEQPIDILDEKTQKTIEEVQRIISYKFRRPELLVEALTHSSHPTDHSYERLEYLGDSILTSAFTNYLFIANPHCGPGDLSSLRGANVSTEKMARVCVKHGFYNFLNDYCQRIGRPLKYQIIRKGGNLVEAQIFVGGELIAVGCSDHKKNAKLAAARVAAKKLDIKEPATDQMPGSAIESERKGEPVKGESKDDLHVFCDKRYWPKPTYKVVRKEGLENNMTYMCAAQVDIPGRHVMTLGDSKKRVRDAEDSAASEMLAYLHFFFSDDK